MTITLVRRLGENYILSIRNKRRQQTANWRQCWNHAVMWSVSPQRHHGSKKLGTETCNFLTDSCEFPTAKLTKSIKDCRCRKIIWNLFLQYICLHKEIVLQNALRYDFALLSPARFSEYERENSLPVNAFSKKILWQGENFLTLAPLPCRYENCIMFLQSIQSVYKSFY